MHKTKIVTANRVEVDSTIVFSNGDTAVLSAKGGTGDGTVYLHFRRGDLHWMRRVRNSMRLTVLA